MRESLLVDNNSYTEQVATSTDDDNESKQSSGGVQLQPYQLYHSMHANTNDDDINPKLHHRNHHHEDVQNYTEHLYSLEKLSMSYQTHIDYDNIGDLTTLSLSHT